MNRNIAVWMFLAIGSVASLGCHNTCRNCGPCQHGCRPGPIGWQRGGTDYQTSLNHAAYAQQQPGSGVQGAQVGYPYYTTRGPRDFLLNNPPTIGR